MRVTMVRVFFILYCFEAGLLLIFAPWTPVWDSALFQVPFTALRNFGLHPLLRGAITGFGLVHLVWGVHDLLSILLRRSPNPDAGADL